MLTGGMTVRVNTLMCDVSHSKKFHFRRPHVNMKNSKNSNLESVFKNLRFLSPEKPATCERKVKTNKNHCVFEDSRHRVVGPKTVS